MSAPFMLHMAEGLCERGFPTLRFNYAYAETMEREGRRLPPDRRPKLERVHLAALECLQELAPQRSTLLAGKSMGGRMGSYLASEGHGAGCIFLGYPLHPARKPERLRDEHFPAIPQPSLFLQGTRDPLCDLELLRSSLETYAGKTQLRVIDGADHDFAVPKKSGLTREQVLDSLVEHMAQWIELAFPG
ncbi:MAG: putative alpha/beta-hydrolase family hydrolase [Planctomycetota bacterium]|jgi:predicted alpha/beta-hydrolase family hydrolase